MAEINKPSKINLLWSSAGDILDPGDTKYQQGWDVEIPPRQWENYIQNKQDTFNAHVNQHGICVWDSVTEYQLDKSYVQGPTNGIVYRCVQTHTNQNPETDVTNTYWDVAFASPGAFLTEGQGDARYLRITNNLSDVSSPSAARTNLNVYSKAESDNLLPFGYFYGFLLSNNGASPNTSVDVGMGQAKDSTNTNSMFLSSTLVGILQTSGSWTAGNNQNKLDTGARTSNTTYHVFVIRKTSDGSTDILFSLSATAPTMPAGYSGFRRIGRIVTDASNNIRRFFDRGNGRFDWLDPIIEVTATGVANGSSLLTLTGMSGANPVAITNFIVSGDGVTFRALPSDVTDSAINSTVTTYTGGAIGETSAGSDSGAGLAQVTCNSTGQIRIAYRTSSGNVSYRLLTMGWLEVR